MADLLIRLRGVLHQRASEAPNGRQLLGEFNAATARSRPSTQSKRANRHYLVPLLVSVTVFSLVVGVWSLLRPDESQTSAPVASRQTSAPVASRSPIQVSTNGWSPGDLSHLAIVGGILRVDREEGCVYLEGDTGAHDVLWPEGYTAAFDSDGRVIILNASGKMVAIEARTVSAGGGFFPAPPDMSCRTATGDVISIEDDLPPL